MGPTEKKSLLKGMGFTDKQEQGQLHTNGAEVL